MMIKPKTIYIGSYVHSKTLEELEQVEHGMICVDEHGVIEWVENGSPEQLQTIASGYGLSLDDVEIVELDEDELLCPGFIDTHTVSRIQSEH